MSSPSHQSSSSWPPPFQMGGQITTQEDAGFEFKNVTSESPVRTIVDTAEDYIVSFLNGHGGRILWGITDDRQVVGVRLNAKERDAVRKGIAASVHNIQPAMDPSRYRLEFHSVTGGAALSEHCVVEVSIEHVPAADPFYNHSGEAFIRLNGVKQKLSGPKLTAWIKARLPNPKTSGDSIDEPKVSGLVRRIRIIFEKHGLEPAHLTRFFQLRKATFSIELSDLETDGALLRWLDEHKIDWIAKTFLIRREWIDGEDERIHEHFCFDKQPQEFFTTISQHLDALVFEGVNDSAYAYFLRWGIGNDWHKRGESRIFVVLAVPLARFSNERTVFKFITDFCAYPWDYPRTYVQLRAWARLLYVSKGVHCFGNDISFEAGTALEVNRVFLRDVIENGRLPTRDNWHPENYALYQRESMVARETQTLPNVIEFLRQHNLPWEESSFGGKP